MTGRTPEPTSELSAGRRAFAELIAFVGPATPPQLAPETHAQTLARLGHPKTPAARRAQSERKAAAAAARDARRRAKFLATSQARDPDCVLLPNDVPQAARQIVWRTMRGEKSAERELARLCRSPFGRAVEVAARAMVRTPDGFRRPTRSLARRRARRVVAVAAVLHFMAQHTTSAGRALLTEGLPRGTLCALFHNDDRGAAVHINTLFGTMLDAKRRDRWDCGAVVALQRSRAIEKLQPPAHTQRPRFVGRDKKGNPRALNQYFLREEVFGDAPEAIEDRALADWDAWLAGAAERARARARARPPPR